jgi:hypothetical protein
VFESSTNKMRFREAFDNYFDAITRYCLRRLPQSNANDAAASVFVVVWRKIDADASGGAAPEGVEDLVYTAVFDSEAHAVTHVGGLLNSRDTVCAIDRPGVAIKTGQ